MTTDLPELPPEDAELLELLRAEWERRDPPAEDLADRVILALALADLDAELARLEAEVDLPVGARAAEPTRSLTFTSEHASVMVTLTPRTAGRFRLDGWVAPAFAGQVELRRAGDGDDRAAVDDDGRFVLDDVAAGLVQLVYVPAPGGDLVRPVAAPPVQL
ncbi:carboxypeptidase regulatory-like domain-containing protein [Georgenia muralis]